MDDVVIEDGWMVCPECGTLLVWLGQTATDYAGPCVIKFYSI